MLNRERFKSVFAAKLPDDRLPVMEWAGWWWDKTVVNWQSQGLSQDLDFQGVHRYFGLDEHHQFWIAPQSDNCPRPPHHGAPVLENEKDYEEFKSKKYLYAKENFEDTKKILAQLKPRHDAGEIMIWMSLDGFFWYPRTLLGIENHLFAFYDYPELMKQMNQDLVEYNLWVIEEFCKILTPEFVTIAEDMSYNHGPMLSKGLFDEFLAPYYRQVVPALKKHGIKVIVDTDGDVEPLIPWLLDVGVEGILPLERMAGVDVNRILDKYPTLTAIGAYDKTIMRLGEDAMRKEFERLLPAMKTGRYIAAVDHQTPPDVSVENYKIYVRLLTEYSTRAVKEK